MKRVRRAGLGTQLWTEIVGGQPGLERGGTRRECSLGL